MADNPVDHYFSDSPTSDSAHRQIQVTLQGADVTVTTDAAVFSKGHLDAATALLLKTVPPPPQQGVLVDVGCGWGPIALSLALAAPEAEVVAVDPNVRARELTAQNAAALGLANVRVWHPDEVPADFRCDLIWSNPPVRIGKAAFHELLLQWVNRLTDGADAWWVIGKNLGADSAMAWLQQHTADHISTGKARSAKGFRIVHTQTARPAGH